MTKQPLVVVIWNDAWTKEDGTTLEDAKFHSVHSPTLVHTIGWVLHEDEGGIQIANEYYDETWRGRTYVPRAMIKEIKHYKLTTPRAKKPLGSNEQ